MTTFLRRWGVCLAAVTLLATSCSSDKETLRPMHLKVLSGTAELTREGSSKTVRGETSVRAGDRIAMSRDGAAELSLASGRLFELVETEVVVRGDTRVALEKGELLASLAAPALVSGGGLEVTSEEGVFRVDRSLSTRLGVYRGEASLQADEGPVAIPRLRQAIVAGDVVPKAPKPLRIDPDDSWDRRFLQEALDLDLRLTSFGRGLEAQLGVGAGRSFFAKVMPAAADLGFLDPFLQSRRSDVLIGLAVASEAVRSEGAIADRFGQAFGLWSEGATWGLIAFEFGIGQSSIFDRLIELVRLAGIRLGGPISPGGGSGGGPQPSPSPTSPGPRPTPSPSPSPSPTEPIQDLIDELIDQLPVPLPSPPL